MTVFEHALVEIACHAGVEISRTAGEDVDEILVLARHGGSIAGEWKKGNSRSSAFGEG